MQELPDYRERRTQRQARTTGQFRDCARTLSRVWGPKGEVGLTECRKQHGETSPKADAYAEPGIKVNFKQWDRWKDRAMGEHSKEDSRLYEWKGVDKRKAVLG